MRRSVPFAAWATVALTCAFALWSGLTLATGVLSPLDHTHPTVRPGGWWAEAATAVAFVTQPFIVMPLLAVVLGGWATRAKLHRFASSVVAAVIVGWAAEQAAKRLFHRPRPPHAFEDLSTAHGFSYPSGHVVAFTLAAILVSVAVAISRRRRRVQVLARLACALVVLAIALNRWLLGVHFTTDLIGGVLLGALIAAASVWACGVHVDPRWALLLPSSAPSGDARQCAVVVNPTKVIDPVTFRRVLTRELVTRGWAEPLWFETTPDDPGHQMARDALGAGADLVLAAGGDGTVRVVASELAHTGVPMGLIPSGTANLLARNLGVPTDLDAAVGLALDGTASPIDLVRVTVDGRRDTSTHIAVMGGLGIDGMVMGSTDPRLKKTVKSMAYAVAIAQHLQTAPTGAVVTLDGQVVHSGPATLMLVGNAGEIQTGLSMFPEARVDDGLLDVLVTAPRNLGEWFAYGVGVLLRRRHKVVMKQGRHLHIEVDEALPYELDGDTIAQVTTFDARVEPASLLVVRP